jgi:hypothetical protein
MENVTVCVGVVTEGCTTNERVTALAVIPEGKADVVTDTILFRPFSPVTVSVTGTALYVPLRDETTSIDPEGPAVNVKSGVGAAGVTGVGAGVDAGWVRALPLPAQPTTPRVAERIRAVTKFFMVPPCVSFRASANPSALWGDRDQMNMIRHQAISYQ